MSDRRRDHSMERVVPQQFLSSGKLEGGFLGLLMAKSLLFLFLRG